MPRTTNNSLWNADEIDLTISDSLSPAKSRRKSSAKKSNLSAHVLIPSLTKDEPSKEPLKRETQLNLPPRQGGRHYHVRDSFVPQHQLQFAQHSFARASNEVTLQTRPGLLPSPTFRESAENVRPGPYTNDLGHTFMVDNDMIDAAQALMQIYNSGTDDLAQRAANEAERAVRGQAYRSPVRPPISNAREEGNRQPKFETWRDGDARREIVASGLSPRARRIRDSMQIDANSYASDRSQVDETAAFPARSVRYTDEAYWNNKALNVINDSPPKRRQIKEEADDSDEDDATEIQSSSIGVEDEDDDQYDDENTADPDYEVSCPLKPSTRRRQSTVSRTSRPRRASMRQTNGREQVIPSTPFSGASKGDSADTERSETPQRPSTSPISETPTRAMSRESIAAHRSTTSEYTTPPVGNLPTPSSTSSLQRWLRDARQSQSHRRTASLESFLEESRKRFFQLKNDELSSDSDGDLQLRDVRLVTPPGETEVCTPQSRAEPSGNVGTVTPASTGVEEGEIIDDNTSDETAIVSLSRQREIGTRSQLPEELDY